MYYNRYRYYDPEVSQYISPDPIGLAGGAVPTAYVHQPTGWVDPLGLCSCFGNKEAPKNIRDKDLPPDENGILHSQSGEKWPQGKSLSRDPNNSGLTGHYHNLPDNVEMPEGLGIIDDGRDVGGPHGIGHTTIFPTRDMTQDEFNEKFQSLPWSYGGKVK